MENWTEGQVIIKGKKSIGILKKHLRYSGVLNGAPGIYGYSVNQNFKKQYHHDDVVEVRYQILKGNKKNNYDEILEFEILE